ncbi:hypothetical protein JTB14_025291 [Gonioctena quinquepunctata]|nr:hypothetical protein JTB14_025291 [Gonioctena quinquepunctata]
MAIRNIRKTSSIASLSITMRGLGRRDDLAIPEQKSNRKTYKRKQNGPCRKEEWRWCRANRIKRQKKSIPSCSEAKLSNKIISIREVLRYLGIVFDDIGTFRRRIEGTTMKP